MSTSYGPLTANQITVIERKIHNASWNATKLLNFFRVHNGLILNIGRGQIKHTITKWEKMKPGQISGSLQDLPDSHGRLTETTTTLAMLATKVVIPVQMRDAWASTDRVGVGDMLDQTVQKQLLAMYQQVDQFIANGDAMKTPLTNDFAAGEGKFTGLFNGFTSFSGGIGEDDDVTAAGDYLATFLNAKTDLKNAGFDSAKYFILSDVDTAAGAEQGNNLYTTYIPTTEKDIIMKREDVIDWIDTPTALTASSEKKMVILTPYTSTPDGAQGSPAFRLIQGYDFAVIPLYNGGLGPTMAYEIAVVWSGALEEIHSEAVRNTGALTLT